MEIRVYLANMIPITAGVLIPKSGGGGGDY